MQNKTILTGIKKFFVNSFKEIFLIYSPFLMLFAVILFLWTGLKALSVIWLFLSFLASRVFVITGGIFTFLYDFFDNGRSTNKDNLIIFLLIMILIAVLSKKEKDEE